MCRRYWRRAMPAWRATACECSARRPRRSRPSTWPASCHRDLCPRNLLFTKHGTKLIDFGLTVPAYGRFLEPGVRVGNPNYMAPEVIRRKPIDQRLDVFAFGVTAYKICSQELPWPAGTTGMAAMSHDQTPVDIREHRPKLDPILARAIHWCLESDAERRCPSMQKLLETIRGLDREEVG